jgi:anti-sigma B factor antagonist
MRLPETFLDPMWSVDVLPERCGALVAVSGDLDMASGDLLIDRVRSVFKTEVEHVCLNLAGLSFIDSSGLQALIVLRNEARGRGVPFTLIEVPPNVQRVIDLTGLADVFDWSSPTA